MIDPVALAADLIRRRSVTPEDDGALPLLADHLQALGFETQLLTFGEPPDGPVLNLFARRGASGPHLAFAGHTDVVPPGDGWAHDPFEPVLADGALAGRGAADMKAALAAMVTAAERWTARGAPGSLSFILTGDEEGPATFGTAPLLDWMTARGHAPDACIVGEPTCAARLGDTVKHGRRGSLNAWIAVAGTQGHVAYPQRAANPVPPLIAILAALQARALDSGTPDFDPSNLEVTDLHVGNPATNLIPAEAHARLNIRFNPTHTGADLARWIAETARAHQGACQAKVEVRISGEAFITAPGPLTALVQDAAHAVTGIRPALSTTGGTSDARFIRRLCPVVEFGLPGATMHKVGECVAQADIHALADVYDEIVKRRLG